MAELHAMWPGTEPGVKIDPCAGFVPEPTWKTGVGRETLGRISM